MNRKPFMLDDSGTWLMIPHDPWTCCKTAAVLQPAKRAGAKDRLRHVMEEKCNAQATRTQRQGGGALGVRPE